MYGKLAVLLLTFALSQGAPTGPGSYGAPPPPPPPPPPPAPQPIPPYAYGYEVQDAATGNDFSAEEEAKGGAVLGQYKVLRADGITMTVTYSVEGDSGFVADVVTEAAPGSGAGGAYGAPLPTYA